MKIWKESNKSLLKQIVHGCMCGTFFGISFVGLGCLIVEVVNRLMNFDLNDDFTRVITTIGGFIILVGVGYLLLSLFVWSLDED